MLEHAYRRRLASCREALLSTSLRAGFGVTFSSIQHLCVTGASRSPPPILPAYSDSATSLPKSPPATALLHRPLASRPRRTASQSSFFPPAMIVPLAPRTVADTRHRAAANLRLRVEP